HAKIGLHRLDLADIAERLDMKREIGVAHRDPHAIAALGQRAHDMAADETAAAENRDERGDRYNGGHRWLSIGLPVQPLLNRIRAKGKGRELPQRTSLVARGPISLHPAPPVG